MKVSWCQYRCEDPGMLGGEEFPIGGPVQEVESHPLVKLLTARAHMSTWRSVAPATDGLEEGETFIPRTYISCGCFERSGVAFVKVLRRSATRGIQRVFCAGDGCGKQVYPVVVAPPAARPSPVVGWGDLND